MYSNCFCLFSFSSQSATFVYEDSFAVVTTVAVAAYLNANLKICLFYSEIQPLYRGTFVSHTVALNG